MNATGWIITIGSIIPALAIAIGSIIFAARAKSCSSFGLALAALAQAVMAIFWPIYRLVIYRAIIEAGEYDLLQGVDIAVNALSILIASVFAVFLLVVLMGKPSSEKKATPHPVVLPQPVYVPVPPTQVPQPSGPPYAPPPPPQASTEE